MEINGGSSAPIKIEEGFKTVMTIFESVTFSIAALGAVLGVINTWVGLSKERVRLAVIPKHAIPVGAAASNIELGIEIINLSAFPVTISEVGVFYRGTTKRSVIPNPIDLDQRGFPRRLDSRESMTIYCEKPRAVVDGHRMSSVFAKTDCGIVRKGSSPAFKQMAGNH